MRKLRFLGAAVVGVAAGMQVVAAAHADTRVALVIGNSAYENVARLTNPTNDANLIANALKKDGFGVTLADDLDHDELIKALQAFGNQADGADWAVIYYAGHGIEMAGTNYLIPVDAKLATDRDVGFEAVPMDQVMSAIDGARSLRMVILDACRNDPFLETMKRGAGAGRDIGRGLAVVEPGQATMVAYSAKAGTIAADGDGADSPFATALAQHLTESGVEIDKLFRLVRDDVLDATGKKQEPFVYGSLPGRQDFYFRPAVTIPLIAGVPETPPVASPPDNAEVVFWQSILNSTSRADFEAYLAQYPNGSFVPLARTRAGLPAKAAADSGKPVAAPPPNAEVVFWQSILNSTSGADFEAYLAQYPNGSFVPLARTRLAALEPAPAPKPEPPALPACDGGLVASVGNAGVAAAAERCLKPKDVFRDCEHCPEMVVVPAGSFTMGSPASEKDRDDNEGPQHEVRIGAPFAVGKFEITHGQFAAFVNDTGYKPSDSCWILVKDKFVDTKGRSFRDPGFPQDDSHPVVCISWDDAKVYVAWLAKTTGKTYRLLSEAEYEYAGRAGTTTAYFFGNDPSQLCDYAHGANQTTKAQFPDLTTADCKDGYVYTAPVGSFAANDFGLYDMVGNVWEWLEDCWHDSYAGAPNDGSAWTAESCEMRALRGGAWDNVPRILRAAVRIGLLPGGRDDGVGFRVARTL